MQTTERYVRQPKAFALPWQSKTMLFRLCRMLALPSGTLGTCPGSSRPSFSTPTWPDMSHSIQIPVPLQLLLQQRWPILLQTTPWPPVPATVAEVYQFRAYVDEAMLALIETTAPHQLEMLGSLITLGLNHEQQHQELLFTDIKYNLSVNPLRPAYQAKGLPRGSATSSLRWAEFESGVQWIGHDGNGFAFDNEWPRHQTYIRPYRLASRLVTNGEYLELMGAAGYQSPEMWLSDGWKAVQERQWNAPLYWERVDGAWWVQTLSGMQPLDEHGPVAHVSYYEADAYARWLGKRLPSEQEWEHAAGSEPIKGNFLESGIHHPVAATGDDSQLEQLFGDLWEWTQSPYAPYPGYRPFKGALGEYNGKFMVNQMVLRGGSCATPESHIRATYRNFFPPDARWQFSGIRLADDA